MTQHQKKERRREMAAAVGSGEDARDVAKRYGMTVATVLSACAENGVKPAKHVPLMASTYAIIADLFGPATLVAIGLKHGVSAQCVWQIYSRCREVGIPVRDRTPESKREAS